MKTYESEKGPFFSLMKLHVRSDFVIVYSGDWQDIFIFLVSLKPNKLSYLIQEKLAARAAIAADKLPMYFAALEKMLEANGSTGNFKCSSIFILN